MDKYLIDNDSLNWKSDKAILLDIKDGMLFFLFFKFIVIIYANHNTLLLTKIF